MSTTQPSNNEKMHTSVEFHGPQKIIPRWGLKGHFQIKVLKINNNYLLN